MKKLLVGLLALGSIASFASVECKTLPIRDRIDQYTENDQIIQDYINDSCDSEKPYSISQVKYHTLGGRSENLGTRVCCTQK